jgi:hypothetical protein
VPEPGVRWVDQVTVGALPVPYLPPGVAGIAQDRRSASIERSITDGSSVPIHVETRLVDFHIDKAALDEESAVAGKCGSHSRSTACPPPASCSIAYANIRENY